MALALGLTGHGCNPSSGYGVSRPGLKKYQVTTYRLTVAYSGPMFPQICLGRSAACGRLRASLISAKADLWGGLGLSKPPVRRYVVTVVFLSGVVRRHNPRKDYSHGPSAQEPGRAHARQSIARRIGGALHPAVPGRVQAAILHGHGDCHGRQPPVGIRDRRSLPGQGAQERSAGCRCAGPGPGRRAAKPRTSCARSSASPAPIRAGTTATMAASRHRTSGTTTWPRPWS